MPSLAVPALSDMELENLDDMEQGGICVDTDGRLPDYDPDAAGNSETNIERLRQRIRIASSTGATLMNAHASGSTHGTVPILTDGAGDGAFAASARHARAPAPLSDADPRTPLHSIPTNAWSATRGTSVSRSNLCLGSLRVHLSL